MPFIAQTTFGLIVAPVKHLRDVYGFEKDAVRNSCACHQYFGLSAGEE